jgi:hypothetical protein
MSAKTPDTDAPAFGVRHVTVVPTNLRTEDAVAARDHDENRERDADAE